jgi:hypothetical protein
MSPATATLVAGFEVAAKAAQQDEDAVRKRMVEEVARLELQRAFAYRKLNLVRTLCAAMTSAETRRPPSPMAWRSCVPSGWEGDSETRTETLSHLKHVVRATFAALAPAAAEGCVADVATALAEFEAWCAARYQRPFWVVRGTLTAFC